MELLPVQQQGQIIKAKAVNSDLIADFLRFVDVAPKSFETYHKAICRFYVYLRQHASAHPTRQDVIAYRDYLLAKGMKATTVQLYLTAVKLFFRWTAQEGLYPNIADHVKGVKISREHKKDYLTSKQVKTLMRSVDRSSLTGLRDYALLALLVTGGLRTVEAMRADVGDLRPAGDNTVLYVQGKGKTEKADYVKISPQVEQAIRDYLAARGTVSAREPLFTSDSNRNANGRMTTGSISRIVKQHLRACGYDSDRLTAHSLRHTAITLSLMGGKGITEVQQHARHANIATTMIYNHALDKAANGCADTVAKMIF